MAEVCKECGTELYIMDRGNLQFENDDTAEQQTKAYYIFQYGCRNPHCKNHSKKGEAPIVLAEKKVYID